MTWEWALSAIGMLLCTFGVLLLGREVWLAQRTEFLLLYLHQASAHAAALLATPLEQAKKDHDEMMRKKGELSLSEQLALVFANVVWSSEQSPEVREKIRADAEALGRNVEATVRERLVDIRERLAEDRLKSRKRLLYLGIASAVVGILLQLASTSTWLLA